MSDRIFIIDKFVNRDKVCYAAPMGELSRGTDKGEAEPRGARRKRETRSKLIEAAYRLMAERGMEAVAINEITEAADVGFGSFYNHFESKQAIYDAVVAWVFEEFTARMDTLVSGISDPAEIIAVITRHTLRRAQREPLWGQFFIRESLALRTLDRGLGQGFSRDVLKGIEAGRFSSADRFMTIASAGGAILVSIAAAASESQNPIVTRQNLPERCAATVLHILGLDSEEADEIARRPLPR